MAAAPGASGWIERALADGPADAAARRRAEKLLNQLIDFRLGCAFWAPSPAWSDATRLVVKADSRADLRKGMAMAQGLSDPGAIAVLLPRRRWAAAEAARLRARGAGCWIGPADPWGVLSAGRAVIAPGDDELAVLAVLAGHRAHLTRAGVIGGWGLTQDAPQIPRRGDRSRLDLAAACLFAGVRYYNPYDGRVTTCESTMERLAEWRRLCDQDRDIACLTGIANWKRPRLRRFLAPGARTAPMLHDAARCVETARDRGGAIAAWPSLAPDGLFAAAREAKVAVRRIEDGFVRSVGLGSDLLPPCSLVIDRTGVYYDPTHPSDLETILAETAFTPALEARAERLVERLLAARLTKYNTGGGGFARPAARRVVLVPGQVEDDQSFRLGGAGCEGNLDLLRRARAQEPDAFIVYRPHPDVEAGNRLGAALDEAVLALADQIDRGSAMPALLDGVDAVHTLTSLAGFEALLRGREVIVHGQPFYSGWGLTRDLAPPPRRGRPLTLAQLAAGTLILYPRYLDPVSGLPCPPEVLIERLAGREGGAGAMVRAVRAVRRRIERLQGAAPGGGRPDRRRAATAGARTAHV